MARVLIDKQYKEYMLPSGLIAFEVYEENYVGNDKAQALFDNFCSTNNCSGFLAVSHRYGEKDPETGIRPVIKTHRHGAIWQNLTTRRLNRQKIEMLLDSICPNYPAYMCDDNNAAKRKALALYSVHLTPSASLKEQFDLRDPIDEEGKRIIEVNADGMSEVLDERSNEMELRTNIHDPKQGYIEFGNCCYANLIHKTIRERAAEIAQAREDSYNVILEYIYTNKVWNFADLMKWAMDNHMADAVAAYATPLRSILSDMRKSAYFTKKNAVDIQNELTSLILTECIGNFVDLVRKANDLDKENECNAYVSNIMSNVSYYKALCNEMHDSEVFEQSLDTEERREHIEMSRQLDKHEKARQHMNEETRRRKNACEAFNKAKTKEYACNALAYMLTCYGKTATMDKVKAFVTEDNAQDILDASDSLVWDIQADICEDYLEFANENTLKEGVVF